MLKNLIIGVLCCFVATNVWSGEMRQWSSAGGKSSFEGSVVRIMTGKVVLENSAGREVTVPISKLCKADQEYLKTVQSKLNTQKEQAEQALDLPYPQGEMVGPIEAASRSSYYLYLPKSLKKGRDAPLLFYTHSEHGTKKLIQDLLETAEITGWVLAVSVESRNNNSDNNTEVSKKAVEHILDEFPVDDDRLYFTGNSGGGAQSFKNCDAMDGCGVMPNVAYIPGSIGPPKCDAFIMGGGFDYNRYISAHARKQIGDTATHRLYWGGHRGAPAWVVQDGMMWLEGRYLKRKGKRVPDEQADYVAAMLEWIEEIKTTESHRAYYWAAFLKENINLSSANGSSVQALIDELGQDKNNRLYAQGLKDIDQLSLDELTKIDWGSKYDHVDSEVVSACNELLKIYKGVPVIDKTLQAISKSTVPKK